MDEKALALDAIRKKLVGENLTYEEIYAIIKEISEKQLGDVLTTYFAASGYTKGFSEEEIYYLTKAMIETGQRLEFKGIVADKHSIGGVPGTRTTLIIIPIVAAAGFTIPKSSSRAITTPGGTADDMEVLAPVEFSKEEISRIVEETNGCIVWGGGVDIAPADDILIQVEEPLLFESFDKILVSIMAKKIAFGSNHIIIDLPYGPTVKVHSLKDARLLKEKFIRLAKRFDVQLDCLIQRTEQPFGRGIGPLLETREALKVLEQTADRPADLEVHSLALASHLLELCLTDTSPHLREQIKKNYGNAAGWATHLLHSGQALGKLKEIIIAQGGDPAINSKQLIPGKHSFPVIAHKNGRIQQINSKNATIIAKILGAPQDKKAGIFLDKKINDRVETGETLYTLYSENEYNLKEAKDSLRSFPISLFY